MTGSISVGPYFHGTVQEQITKLIVSGQSEPDMQVDPLPPTNSNVLYQTQLIQDKFYIADWKQVSSGAAGVGNLASYTQLIFYTWVDRFGNYHSVQIGSFNFNTQGIQDPSGGTTSWEVDLVN